MLRYVRVGVLAVCWGEALRTVRLPNGKKNSWVSKILSRFNGWVKLLHWQGLEGKMALSRLLGEAGFRSKDCDMLILCEMNCIYICILSKSEKKLTREEVAAHCWYKNFVLDENECVVKRKTLRLYVWRISECLLFFRLHKKCQRLDRKLVYTELVLGGERN